MLLLLISFIAGLLTVLAPCILPLLPVIIGGSLSGEAKALQKKKVITIVTSLALSVIAFTLLLKASTLFIDIPQQTWKYISGGIILVLGLVTVFPQLWEGQWLAKLSAKSNIFLGKGSQKKNFWGDVTIGAALGPVFSTCSPTYFVVLATVLPAQPIVGLVYLFAYTAGLSLALFIIAIVGQKIMSKLNIAADTHGWFKRSLGILFILVGLAIVTGVDKKIETAIVNAGFFDVTKVEQRLLELTEDQAETEETGYAEIGSLSLAEKSSRYELAKEISTPNGFINTDGEEITLESLKGKVVLLDVWTYSCINCQRTIPYLNAWHEKYADEGLVIIGLHTPEFAFEKIPANVQKAVDEFGIKYPVILDNDYSTWNAYGNKYWPRKYLIDIDGYIVYDHIGEGGYAETEANIQKALAERSKKLGQAGSVSSGTVNPENVLNPERSKVKSPEVYFGAARNKYLANGEMNKIGQQDLVVPTETNLNKLYLGGQWMLSREYAENEQAAAIVFPYEAKDVYFVAGSANGVEVEVYQDYKYLKTIIVKEEQLYRLVEDEDYGRHVLRLEIKQGGLQAFTFTFG